MTLGAGNTGRDFDLETDRRVAEFKFITWRGGSETIRQNGVFKDYLKLLWHSGSKERKQLFLTGTREALAFLRGRRAISSVLSRNVKLKDSFEVEYGTQYHSVGEFYRAHENGVDIVDLFDVIPQLSRIVTSGAREDDAN